MKPEQACLSLIGAVFGSSLKPFGYFPEAPADPRVFTREKRYLRDVLRPKAKRRGMR